MAIGLSAPIIWISKATETVGVTEDAANQTALSHSPAEKARAELPDRQNPQLVVAPPAPRRAGEPAPLGVSIQGSADNLSFLEVKGLAPGTRLSVGFALGPGEWGLFAKELRTAMVEPPASFAGTMDLTVRLDTVESIAIDYRTLRLEWVGRGAIAEQGPGGSAPPAIANEIPRSQEAAASPSEAASPPSQQTADIVKRAKEVLLSGDIETARPLLRRAALAGDASAALALATTYDPIALDRLHAHGLVPDAAMARFWYEKAQELGSREASQRLETLAIETR
ncbi:MAG TPA: hypothetical protein VEK34_16540 [Methylocella sp.]|nr:hypothetical protein [Methylocella sp.]